MKKQITTLAIFAAALVMSADSIAMRRAAPVRVATQRAQRAPQRQSGTMSPKLHYKSPLRRIAERIRPTTEIEHYDQLRKIKEKEFSLAYCAESRITREILLNHARHDELCEKWLNAKKDLAWNRAELAAGIVIMPYFLEALLGSFKTHPVNFVPWAGILVLQNKRVKNSKKEKQSIEAELAELAKEHKRALRLSDDIQ